MKRRTTKELRDELAAAKRELRQLHRRDALLSVEMLRVAAWVFSTYQGSDEWPDWAPKAEEQNVTLERAFNVLWHAGMKISLDRLARVNDELSKDLGHGVTPSQVNALFELAVFEYVAKRNKLPGREDLLRYAKAHAQRLALDSKVELRLTDHRAKLYLNELNDFIDRGVYVLQDFKAPPQPYLEDMACRRPQRLPDNA